VTTTYTASHVHMQRELPQHLDFANSLNGNSARRNQRCSHNMGQITATKYRKYNSQIIK
jgi:hypothetical protein